MKQIIARILALSDKLTAPAEFQRAVFAALTPAEAAPLTKMLRERRQVYMALLPPQATTTAKSLDVSNESKARIEREFRDAADEVSEQRNAFEKLDAWRTKTSSTPMTTIEAMHGDSSIARQLNWLMIEMMEDIEMRLSFLENTLPEADYAAFETRAMELGAKLAEPLDAGPKKE